MLTTRLVCFTFFGRCFSFTFRVPYILHHHTHHLPTFPQTVITLSKLGSHNYLVSISGNEKESSSPAASLPYTNPRVGKSSCCYQFRAPCLFSDARLTPVLCASCLDLGLLNLPPPFSPILFRVRPRLVCFAPPRTQQEGIRCHQALGFNRTTKPHCNP